MKSLTRIVLTLSFLLVLSGQSHAITKVAPRLNLLEFRAGMGIPFGDYGGVGTLDFVDQFNAPTKVSASDLYDPTYSLGLTFGQVRSGHVLYSIGLEFTHINVNDAELADLKENTFHSATPSFNQYDLRFGVDYQLNSLHDDNWTPSLGLSLATGFTGQTARTFVSEYQANLALSATVGAEVKLGKSDDGRSFATLASTNRIDLFVSGHRPQYINLGLALRFYVRP